MIFKDLVNYAINPKIDSDVILGNITLIKQNLNIFIINLLFSILGSAVSIIIISKFNIGQSEYFYTKIPTDSALVLIFINFILLPFSEELTSRLYLIFKPINIAVSMGFIIYSLISLIKHSSYFDFDSFFYIKMSIAIISGIIIYYSLNNDNIKSFCENIWTKYFKYIFYISVFLFGLFHLRRNSLNGALYLLGPLLILPQLICGMTWGFVRVKYGIFWSTLHHIIYNFLIRLPLIILGYGIV